VDFCRNEVLHKPYLDLCHFSRICAQTCYLSSSSLQNKNLLLIFILIFTNCLAKKYSNIIFKNLYETTREPLQHIKCSDQTMGWMILGSIPSAGKKLLSFPKCPATSGAHPASCSVGTGDCFPVANVAWMSR